MSNGIYCALSGAIAQSTALEATATNLANASTTGYQSETPIFHEVLSKTGASPQLRFAALQATALGGERGAVRVTERDLDCALPENVFLAVQSAGGERYTRNGSLQVLPDGALQVAGHPVLSEAGTPISVTPGAAASISPDGEILVAGEVAGRLKLVSFPDAAYLSHEGATLLAATATSGPATAATGKLVPGALEESNASPVKGMTDLMSAQRMFEAFQRAIDAFNDADRRCATTVAGV